MSKQNGRSAKVYKSRDRTEPSERANHRPIRHATEKLGLNMMTSPRKNIEPQKNTFVLLLSIFITVKSDESDKRKIVRSS